MVAPLLIGAGVTALSSLFGSRSARRAAQRAQQQAAEAAAREQAYGREGMMRAQAVGENMPQYTSVSPGTFRPVNLTTGYGATTFNPATGQYESQLAEPLAQQQQFSYGAAQNLANQLGAFDPNAFAQQRYQGYQSLLEPSRQAATSQLLGQLKRKGLLGFEQTPVGGTSTQGYNPLTEGFARAQAQQNEALALKAFGEGTAEQERLAALQSRMFGQGLRLNEPLTEQMRYGYNLGGQEYQRAVDAANIQNRLAEQQLLDRQRMFQLTEPFARQAALGGMEGQQQAATMMNQARLASSQGIARGLQNIGGMFAGSMMPSSGPGMFSSYFGTSPTSAVSSEVSRLGSSTLNPMSDYWTGRGGFGFYGE